MFGFLSVTLSREEIEALEGEVMQMAQVGEQDAAWQKLERLRKAQRHQVEAAVSLLRIVNQQCLQTENAAELLSEIDQSHHQDVELLSFLAECLEAVRDIDDLNAPPPEEEVFRTVVERLTASAQNPKDVEEEKTILRGLATAARMQARQNDEIAEKSYRRLVEIDPQNSVHHYNLGLFCKTRGRFEEGQAANLTAVRLSEDEVECYEWNLGICATGAGDGVAALEVWKRMEQKIEMGRFDLPEGGYPQCKVKLAERPLAERTLETDDPGDEETIWIERLSPCHGIIRSVLYQDLGVNYGDVVLIDGAPITYHTYGDTQIAVFPHLATLLRQNYQIFAFAGTQEEPGQLADVSVDLAQDAIVCSHSESYRELCASCWRDPDLDHDHHEQIDIHVVVGRVAAPPHIGPTELLEQLDAALARREKCQLYAPDLCTAARQDARAQVERRRFDMLSGT
ncbi:MAG: prenyltransferase [Alphaproteobacteria bacterium]|nr:prenyltransferase [Alphaproteobacteria bacterium]